LTWGRLKRRFWRPEASKERAHRPIAGNGSTFERGVRGGTGVFEKISANAILVWFLWGLFMGMGWTIGAWIIGRLLAL
jgi:hypothetical protein